jgi:glycosyltransferase involved in cell wall biosynthesis
MQTILPSVSVIIPVYGNSGRLLLKCVDALANQTYPKHKVEIIVVDNNLTPVIKGYLRDNSEIRVLHESRIGSYCARNKGIKLATGTILAFTDSDCIPHKDWLKCAVDQLSMLDFKAVIGGNIIFTFKKANNPNICELYDSIFHLRQAVYVNQMNFAATANLIAPRDLFMNYGAFNESYFSGGDREWGEKIFDKGIRTYFSTNAVVYHPARSNIWALLEKNIRGVGGEIVRFKTLGLSKLHFISTQIKASKARRKILLSEKYLSRNTALRKLAVIFYVIQIIRIIESVRLLLGGKMRRK